MNVPQSENPVQALLREARLSPTQAEALTGLLHAAAHDTGMPAGTPGEYAALAAFRNAHHESTRRPRGAFAMYRTRTRAALLTAKTAVAAVALVSAGGVAMAASTGALPTPITHPTHPAHPAHPAHPVTPKVSDDQAGFAGLCNAVAAGAWNNPGKAAQSTAFQRLITAAGGQNNVTAFCAALPATTDNAPATQEQGDDSVGGNSANAPGHDPNGPGNSENAPGHNKSGAAGHGRSANAPGHNKSGTSSHGNSVNAPGHDSNGPGNSENAPGHTKPASATTSHGNSGADQGTAGA